MHFVGNIHEKGPYRTNENIRQVTKCHNRQALRHGCYNATLNERRLVTAAAAFDVILTKL